MRGDLGELESLHESRLGIDILGVGSAVGGVTNLVSTIIGGKTAKDLQKKDEKFALQQARIDAQRTSQMVTAALAIGVLGIGAILVYGAVKRRSKE